MNPLQRVAAPLALLFALLLSSFAAVAAGCPDGMVMVPPGGYVMGCSEGDALCGPDEKPVKQVSFDSGFCIGAREVTQNEYMKLASGNPSVFASCGGDCPVENVSWAAAARYCEALGGRLPSEEEWEYAARGGAFGAVAVSDSALGDLAWYSANSEGSPRPVGGKQPNAFGIYDMQGNVWEWTTGCHAGPYDKEAARTSATPPYCDVVTLRGGSWRSDEASLRVSARMPAPLSAASGVNGFRCAADAGAQVKSIYGEQSAFSGAADVEESPAIKSEAKVQVSAASGAPAMVEESAAIKSEAKVEVLPAMGGAAPVVEVTPSNDVAKEPPKNTPPMISVSVSSDSGPYPFAAEFTAVCKDPDGTCVSIEWDFGDGTPPETADAVKHVFVKQGTYSVRAKAVDDRGDSREAVVSIKVVEPPNEPPAAKASADVVSGFAPLEVTFAGGCIDTDGTCAAAVWDFGDGATAEGLSAKHRYELPGEYAAVLTVSDDKGAAAKADIKIEAKIKPPNEPPSLIITAVPERGTWPLEVTLTAVCTDSGGRCVSISWDFGDGSSLAEGDAVRHTYKAEGTFVITATAKDDAGDTTHVETGIEVTTARPAAFTPAKEEKLETAEPKASREAARAAGPDYWAKAYGLTPLADVARCIRATSDGGYIVAGYTSAPPSFNFLVYKLDANGAKQWSRTFGGGGQDIARAAVETSDGGFAVAGYTDSKGEGRLDALVVKFDAAGNEVWSKTLGGLEDDMVRAITALPDGSVVVAGETSSFGSDRQVWLVKLDTAGASVWARNYESNRIEGASAIRMTADGGFIVAGFSRMPDVGTISGRSDMLIMKIDEAGAKQWTKITGGADWDEAYDVAQTADGGYAAVGVTQSTGEGDGDAQVVKLDAKGAEVWKKTFGEKGYNSANAIAAAPDGTILVAGGMMNSLGRQNVSIMKLDAKGKPLWSRKYGGENAEGVVYSLDAAKDGAPVAAGYTYPAGGGDWELFVIKTAPDGGCPGCY